jgi:hypothetical protein
VADAQRSGIGGGVWVGSGGLVDGGHLHLDHLAGDFAAVPAFGVLDLDFVPEPTTLVLGGVALLVTAAIGRR